MRYLAFILAAITSAEMQAFQLAPRLVVNITIDQLRSDYIEAFTPLYGPGGFRRLFADGLVYDGASYPFSPVDRASATASLATGTTPYYHGIVSTQWLDRETLRPVFCVDDKRTGSSPARIMTSTVGDELKVSTGGAAVVYSFAARRESAILAAGHAANGAFWIDENRGWQGSSYYSGTPGWLRAYDRLNPVAGHVGDNHNDAVVEASIQAVTSAAMGQDDVSDMLCVSLSATTGSDARPLQGHVAMESVYIQLDRSLQRLISGIEGQVSPDKVLFVVTSTGYTDEAVADLDRFRIPTGTFYINRTADLLNMYLGAIYGQGRYVEQTYANHMYLNHRLLEQKRVAVAEVLSRSSEFLVQNAGVADVYTSSRLLAGQGDIQKIRSGYHPTISGDIIVEVAPGWKLLNEDTHQTYTSRAGFMPFPIVFLGAGMQPRRVSEPVTVDRIAPTVAKAIRIRAPNACNAIPLF